MKDILLFANYPNLSNELLFTKKIEQNDVNEFVEIYMNPNCFLYTPGSARKTVEAAKNVINHIERDYNKRKFLFIGLYLKETNILIGILEVYNIDRKNDTVEIGYRLNEKYWKLGYGKIGARLLIDYLFNEIQVKRINASAMLKNTASNNILTSLGFILDRQSIQETVWKDKGLVDLNLYYKLAINNKTY